MTPGSKWAPALLLSVLWALPANAQDPRVELIERARGEFDLSAALELLMEASDPNPTMDSVWAMGVHTLASTLLSRADSASAALFLRWAARHGGQWPIDRVDFVGAVVELYDEAAAAVGTGSSDDSAVTRTSWRWPDALSTGSQGAIRVSSADPATSLSLSVEGTEATDDSGRLSLAPGTYEVAVSAPGHESARVTREVLPGVVAELEVSLLPVLTSEVESDVARRIVQISHLDGGQAVCTSGLLVDEGLVLAAYGQIVGASALEVTTAQGVFNDVRVLRADPASDLALLSLGTDGIDPLPEAGTVIDRQYVWGVFHEGCGPVTSRRTQLSGWVTPPAGHVALSPVLAAATGGALVDQSGAFVGFVTNPALVAPAPMAHELLAQAMADLDAQLTPPGGGGMPWKWIGGAGAVGVVAALLLKSGAETPPTTGEIVITIPGG